MSIFTMHQSVLSCRAEVCKALGITGSQCELSMGMSGDFEQAKMMAFPDMALLLWYSFGTIAILLQCVASHRITKKLFTRGTDVGSFIFVIFYNLHVICPFVRYRQSGKIVAAIIEIGDFSILLPSPFVSTLASCSLVYNLLLICISKNNFMGSIPTNLGKMKLLEEPLLSADYFTSQIPIEITKCRNLRLIGFSGNGLSDSIPVELGDLIRLETLVFSVNNLSGSIPTSLSNITALEISTWDWITLYLRIFELSYMKLTATVPSECLICYPKRTCSFSTCLSVSWRDQFLQSIQLSWSG
ncbi:Leucine-rich receptor-like protein kinase family protein [Perilla frutescens var. frutescens]|nr:Leucine-rich receptor-like protein kinase family protein [Perilla frutescens var. frutescens]